MENKNIKIVVVGNSNVGKSSLLLQYTEEKFYSEM
jgi:GTPase SAR1 family protein